MRFNISRAHHDWNENTAPCSGATKDGNSWYVEIPDLDALMELFKRFKSDSIILSRSKDIIIYDDYVE